MLKVAAGLMAIITLASCQPTNPQTWEFEAPVTQRVQTHISESPTMGLAVAIWHKGAWRMQQGWGYADEANHIPATADTQFRTASISKGITAVIAFAAAEQGLVQIASPVKTRTPAIDQHGYSLGDLLANRSGTCHYDHQCDNLTHPDIHFSEPNSYQVAAENIAQQPLAVKKGEIYYSTHAYSIAAFALEKATHKSYQTLLDTYINKPLKTHLRCEDLGQSNHQRATLYEYNTALKPAQADNIEWKCPGGGIEASANELVTLGKALRDHQLLSEKSLAAMITPPDKQLMGEQYFAYGWATPSDDNAHWFGKRGDQLGGRAYLRIYTDEDLVIAIAGNTAGAGAPELAAQIANIILHNEAPSQQAKP